MSEACSLPFDDHQISAIRIATIVGAALSTLGSLFIIVSYFWFPRLRTYPYKLIMFLSIADFFGSSAYFVGLQHHHEKGECMTGSTCIISALMTQYFDISTFCWTAVIGYNIYEIFVAGKGRRVESYERYYHLFAWGFPAVLAIIVGALGAYGDAGAWCWIKADEPVIRFVCYYLPLVMVILYNAINFVIISRATRDLRAENEINFRLRLYLLIFIFVRIWGVFDRIQNAYHPFDPVFWIVFMHSLFSPIQGFANSLVYGCNRQVANEYKYCLLKQDSKIPNFPMGNGMERSSNDLLDQEMTAIQLN